MISLVIPLYNAADHLVRLANSIKVALDRVEARVEVIFIDDGSTDLSASIIESLLADWEARGETRACLVRQANQGRGGARNTGIARATQPYIGFLDADDYLHPDYFLALLECVFVECQDNAPPDIVEFNSDCFVVQCGRDKRCSSITRTIGDAARVKLSSDPAARLRVFQQGHWFAWLRLYKRELFDVVSFPHERNYEDLDTVPQLFLVAETVKHLPRTLISYQINPAGIMQSPSAADEDSLEAISKEHFAAARRASNAEMANCEVLVACSALRSLYYVSEKLHGRIIGLASYRARLVRILMLQWRFLDVARVWSLLDAETRQVSFAPEYVLAKRAIAKLEQKI